MSLSRELLERYSCDPQLLQRVVMETIESANDGDVVLNDPTNPFTMLLEAATTLSSNSILEAKSIIRKKYPSLALAADELYHHITDDHLKSITSQPAECNMKFFISVLDLRLQGNRPKNGGYSEIILPIGTKVTVINTTMTLVNDIRIRLYDNGNTFVEQDNNDNPIAYSDVGLIESTTWTSNNGTPFITFTVKMKQLTKKSYNYSIVSSQGFSKVLPITDKFHNAIVSYKNSNTNGSYVYINKSFNDDYIDPLSLTCFVSLYDTQVLFRIPDMYVTSGLLSGNLNIDIYETRGKVYEPFYRYKIEEDFNVTLGDTGSSASAAAAKNVLIWAHSEDILQGGSNGLTTYELRDEVIEAVVGDMEIPVTEKQINKLASEYGYSLVKSLDVLTERLYIAMKPLPTFNSELLYSRMECLFSNFHFKLDELQKSYENGSKFIMPVGNQMILKSKSLFEYSSDGFVLIYDYEEYKSLEKLSKEKLIEELKDRQLYFNPFYYVINNSTDLVTCDVLDLDNPEVISRKIVGKNTYHSHRANTTKNGIWKTDYGYRFAFQVAGDDNYNSLDAETKKFQVRVKLTTSETYAYWLAKKDTINDLWYIDIYTDLEYEDGTIRLKRPTTSSGSLDKENCVSSITDYIYINLETDFDIYICSTSNTLADDTTNYLKTELWTFNPTEKWFVLTKETFNIKIGEKLDYIYNKIWSSYENLIPKYEEDKEKVYAEDQYELTKGGLRLWYDPDNKKLNFKKTHSKGDVVTDPTTGEVQYEYKKGMNITNEELVKDYNIAHSTRTMSLLLFEYPFLKATNSVYQEYLSQMTKTLNQYITDELETINDRLLEKTQVVFKSSKSIMNVVVTINNSKYYTNFYVKPKITIYTTAKSTYTTEDLDGFRVTLGNILNLHFNNLTIRLEDIRSEMKTALGTDVASVKIENIEETNAEVITINSELNKFVLRKKLDFDTNKELIVKYDIDIEAIYI